MGVSTHEDPQPGKQLPDGWYSMVWAPQRAEVATHRLFGNEHLLLVAGAISAG